MGSFATYDDERCAVGPFGLNGSSDKLVRLPSLTAHKKSQSSHPDSAHHTGGITLPPIRVMIPQQFSPPQTPRFGIEGSPSRRLINAQKTPSILQAEERRMKLDLLMTSPSSSAATDHIRQNQPRQYIPPSDSRESNGYRASNRERSLSEMSSNNPPLRPQLYAEKNQRYDYGARSQQLASHDVNSRNPPTSPWSNGHNVPPPPLSNFERGATSFPALERENGAYTVDTSGAMDHRRWNRRSNSSDYSFHDRSHGFGTMVPGGADYADTVPPPYSWDMSESVENQMNRKRRGNLPKAATTMFKKWFDDHRDSPYPTEEEKARFCRETGLTMNQVGNWFINARRRQPNRGGRDGQEPHRDDL